MLSLSVFPGSSLSRRSGCTHTLAPTHRDTQGHRYGETRGGEGVKKARRGSVERVWTVGRGRGIFSPFMSKSFRVLSSLPTLTYKYTYIMQVFCFLSNVITDKTDASGPWEISVFCCDDACANFSFTIRKMTVITKQTQTHTYCHAIHATFGIMTHTLAPTCPSKKGALQPTLSSQLG